MLHVRPVPRSMRKLVAAACVVVGLGATTGVSPALAAGDGRAYELVSPADKAGNAVDVKYTVQSSDDGNAVAFSIPGAVPGASVSLLGGYYLARRGTDWSSASLDVPQGNSSSLVTATSLYLTPDFSQSIQFSQRALVPGAIEGGGNLYFRDNLTGALRLLASAPGNELTQQFVVFAHGANIIPSDDFSRAVFTSEVALTPDAVAGVANFYEWKDGHLSLAAVLPDGTVDAAGGASGIISRDGSRIIFTAGATGALYLRTGTTTVPISVSHIPGDPDTPQRAVYVGNSADGSIVYFTSRVSLTPDAGGGFLGQLYKYDATNGQLTLVSKPNDPSGQTGDVQGVSAVSADGSYVYFTSTADFTGTAVPNEYNFYVAHDGVVRFIASLGPFVIGGPASASFSPSGRYVAFATFTDPTSADTTGTKCKSQVGTGNYSNQDGECVEMYRYDAQAGKLDCLSCAPVDGENAFSDLGPQSPGISGRTQRQAMLDNGRVFFNSDVRLALEDVNGQRDVYAWRDGVVSLISSGKSAQESTLADASPDGRDVFFFTSEQLVKRDVDTDTDLYDARIGGGIAAQNVPPARPADCQGDGCQGATLAPPTLGTLGSSALSEPEDTSPVRAATPKLNRVIGSATRGGIVLVKVSVSGRGILRGSGSGVGAVRRSVKAKGAYQLKLGLTSRARKSLKAHHQVKVKVRVTFTPAAGKSSSATVSVTVKA